MPIPFIPILSFVGGYAIGVVGGNMYANSQVAKRVETLPDKGEWMKDKVILAEHLGVGNYYMRRVDTRRQERASGLVLVGRVAPSFEGEEANRAGVTRTGAGQKLKAGAKRLYLETKAGVKSSRADAEATRLSLKERAQRVAKSERAQRYEDRDEDRDDLDDRDLDDGEDLADEDEPTDAEILEEIQFRRSKPQQSGGRG